MLNGNKIIEKTRRKIAVNNIKSNTRNSTAFNFNLNILSLNIKYLNLRCIKGTLFDYKGNRRHRQVQRIIKNYLLGYLLHKKNKLISIRNQNRTLRNRNIAHPFRGVGK